MFNIGLESEMLARILAACILGGIIGLERESLNRPAGFRTHMLVTTGAALCMVLNHLFILTYPNMSIDPGRLGTMPPRTTPAAIDSCAKKKIS